MEEIYLDNSATTRVCEKSAEKVLELMTQCYGNPSSLHKKGLEAQREVAHARQAVAVSLGAQPREIIFTSGGTEANNLAVLGGAAASRRRGKRIVTTAIEHPSVLEPMRQLEKEGFEVVFLTPDADGRVPEEAVLKAVTGDTILISVMAVNNELGSIQPIEVLKKAVKRAGAPALVHVDGVQAYGKLPLRPEKLGIDLLTVSGHKIHGPKGVGALYVSKNARILPRTFGGGQERELRPGTEAAPLIAGLGAAVEELPDWRQAYSRMEKLRDYTLQKLSGLEGVEVNSPVEGLPYLLNFSALGIRSETMLHFLAQRGIYVSSGSACAKGKQSHVLKAAGLPDSRISSAIRVSFSRENTERDADALAEGVREGLACLAR
ncbi:MAG: cysteine desulfurase family protein, partial [[Clostridium] leptum]